MTYKDYLTAMSLATAAAWVSWLVVLLTIDPTQSGPLGVTLFYATLLPAVFGSISMLGTAVRVRFKPEDLMSRHVVRSFRQAVWLSLLVGLCLVLLSHSLFRWWIVALCILLFACLELFFLTSQRRPAEDTDRTG